MGAGRIQESGVVGNWGFWIDLGQVGRNWVEIPDGTGREVAGDDEADPAKRAGDPWDGDAGQWGLGCTFWMKWCSVLYSFC
jgi:hypothetical protein